MASSDTKICSHCKVEKNVEEFYKNHKQKDGRDRWCIACKKESGVAYRNKNRERLRAQTHEWYKNNRAKGVEIVEKVECEEGRKVCYKCKEEKSTDEFYGGAGTRDGLQSMCKDCTVIRHREYYERNKEEIAKKSKKRYEDNKEEIRERAKECEKRCRERRREERLEERRKRVLEGLKKEQPSEESY